MHYRATVLLLAATLQCSPFARVRAIDADHQMLKDIYDLHQLEGSILLQVGMDSGCAAASKALLLNDTTELKPAIERHRDALKNLTESLLDAILEENDPEKSPEHALWKYGNNNEKPLNICDANSTKHLNRRVRWRHCQIKEEDYEINTSLKRVAQMCRAHSGGCDVHRSNGNSEAEETAEWGDEEVVAEGKGEENCEFGAGKSLDVYGAALNFAVSSKEVETKEACYKNTKCVPYARMMRERVERLAGTLLDLSCLMNVREELAAAAAAAPLAGNSTIERMVARFRGIWNEASSADSTNWDGFTHVSIWRTAFESRLLSLACSQVLPLMSQLSKSLSS